MTDKPLHVGLVLATSTGGIGTHVASLARFLLGAGHEVTVCGPIATDELFGFEALGARFCPVEISRSPSPFRDLLAMMKLRRKTAGVDLLHAHGLRAGFIAAGSRRRPLVVTWHNLQLAQGSRGRRFVQLERLLSRVVDVAIGVSEDLVARVRGFGAVDARFLSAAAPPLPKPRRAPGEIRRELDIGTRPLILSVARLDPQKSLNVLIQAAAGWVNRDPIPAVVIAGSGPDHDELAELIERLNAPVTLLGRRSDIADLLAVCDIAVLISQWEGSPLFLQEALRAGKPMVATAVGGMPGLAGDAAVLIPPGDVTAIDIAVSGLLDDETLAADLAARAAARGCELPSEDECSAAVVALYTELVPRTQVVWT